jgi:hypothetical protein
MNIYVNMFFGYGAGNSYHKLNKFRKRTEAAELKEFKTLLLFKLV